MSLHTAILEGADVLMASASTGSCPFDRLNNGDPVGSSVVEALVRRVRSLEMVAEDRAQTIARLLKAPVPGGKLDEFGLCAECGR